MRFPGNCLDGVSDPCHTVLELSKAAAPSASQPISYGEDDPDLSLHSQHGSLECCKRSGSVLSEDELDEGEKRGVQMGSEGGRGTRELQQLPQCTRKLVRH